MDDDDDANCPYDGGHHGRHMGRWSGYGMGPGMMGPGYGMGPGMMGSRWAGTWVMTTETGIAPMAAVPWARVAVTA